MNCTPNTKVGSRGFTLIEILVAAAIGGLLFAAVASMMMFNGQCTASLGNYMSMNRDDENALDTITTDIRQALCVTNCTGTNLQLLYVDPATLLTNGLSYNYDPVGHTLSRVYGGVTTTLLTKIVPNSVQFVMYQRNPVGGTVTQYQTTNPAICKVVQLSWICSNNVIALANTESVQSALVVIRKE